jgi:hypothetical protein
MGITTSAPAASASSRKAAIAEPVPSYAARAASPSGGTPPPTAKRASGVGTGE